jgi:hypothetical protein
MKLSEKITKKIADSPRKREELIAGLQLLYDRKTEQQDIKEITSENSKKLSAAFIVIRHTILPGGILTGLESYIRVMEEVTGDKDIIKEIKQLVEKYLEGREVVPETELPEVRIVKMPDSFKRR